tara:strand:- start:1436 stop:1966 length:531 start_codon:yes stop_codon:yes gene_type:complete
MKLTFGKYRNQQLSKVHEDTSYKNWLLNQQFFKDQYSDEYQYLLNYKEPINFTDLPCDIKSMIFGINYNAEKSAHEAELAREKEQGIVRYGNKGKKKIVKRTCEYTGRIKETHTSYINCKECGRHLNRNGGGFYNEQAYECCPGCYEKFRRDARQRREQQRQLRTNFCLFSDSDEE